jgi:hypothetical protein
VRAHDSAVGELVGVSPSGAPGLGGLGFLAQNGAGGKGILTRGALMEVWSPRRLAGAGLFLQSFNMSWGSSKASMMPQLGIERRWLLLKLVGWFNCYKDRHKITSHGVLGFWFWFWWLEIGANRAPFYRGFLLMSYPRRTPCHFISKLTSNREESQ